VNMAKEMTSLRQSAGMAAALIGKEVSWVETEDTGVVNHSGIVDSIIWRDGKQFAKVDNVEVAMDKILSISEPAKVSAAEVTG
jgi:flagellar basal-body rod modification protein FlgD